MANNENLVPLSERSEEERREIAKQGGIASGEARRKRKKMKECLEVILESETHYDFADMTGIEAVAKSLFNKALDGDTRAILTIRDMIGEKPKEDDEQ